MIMKENIKQFFYLLDSPAKKEAPFLIGVFLLSSLLDVIGIGLIGAFLFLLLNPMALFYKVPFLKILLPNIAGNQLLIICGVLIIVAIAMKSFAVIAVQKKTIFFAQNFGLRLKTRLMTAYQSAPYIYYLKKNSNYLISRIQENVNGLVNSMLMAVLTLISSVLMTVAIIVTLLIFHPLPTLILLALLISVGMGYDMFMKKDSHAMGKIIAEAGGEISNTLRHALHGLTEVRVFGREAYFSEKLKEKYNEALVATAVVTKQQLLPRYLIENIMSVFTITICIGGIALGYSAATILSLVGMFAVAGSRLLPMVTQIMTGISQVRAGSHNIHLVYNELTEIDKLTKNSSQSALSFAVEPKLPFSVIEIKRVSYIYPEANILALSHINISILKGQSIGLIGPSGSGKSTLVNLILGFLEPQEGKLLVDGHHVKNLRSWLNNFAYIPQSIFLVDDTLCRNIAFGMKDKEIDRDRILDAIRMAQLTEVVQNLPHGIETSIGENGICLSGGQRQRIALARAFYNERDIIIMDEATSSLDNETEKEVINTIKRLKGVKTLIVIAHRLSTIEHCDVLYRIEKGSIVKSGSFREVVNCEN